MRSFLIEFRPLRSAKVIWRCLDVWKLFGNLLNDCWPESSLVSATPAGISHAESVEWQYMASSCLQQITIRNNGGWQTHMRVSISKLFCTFLVTTCAPLAQHITAPRQHSKNSKRELPAFVVELWNYLAIDMTLIICCEFARIAARACDPVGWLRELQLHVCKKTTPLLRTAG